MKIYFASNQATMLMRGGPTFKIICLRNALQKIGVNVDNLLVSQPDTGEQALEICDMLVRSGAVDVVIVDSVAALTPKAEIEGEMSRYLDIFRRHNLNQLAAAKPGLIETRVNNGTKEVFDSIENDSKELDSLDNAVGDINPNN